MARPPSTPNEISSGYLVAPGPQHLTHYFLALLYYVIFFTLFFSPAIFRGKLLAVGDDARYNFLPYFYSTKVLWDTRVFGGFPMMADPTAMSWYPPAWIISRVIGSWNLFMIGAFVAAGFFIYGYVYRVTRCSFGGLVSGTVFGISGFMIAHLGHPHIVQSAAWVPLLLWSLESLRPKLSAKWFVIGSLAVALVFLGGQPQIFAYGLMLAVAYTLVMGWSRQEHRRRYYLAALAMVILGVGLAAAQIAPTAELIKETSRAAYTFPDYASHSLPPRQLLTLVFPYVFGGPSHLALVPYFGAPNQTEISGYVGLLPLLLSLAALYAKPERRLAIYWFSVAIVGLLLAMGDATPLARIFFQIPILSSFRAQGRHLFEFTLATSALSGVAVAGIVRGGISKATTIKVALFGSVAMGLVLIALFANSAGMHTLAARSGIGHFNLRPWLNPAVGEPLIIFALVVTAFIFWRRKPVSPHRKTLLLIVLVIDLGSFGWFFEWRYATTDKKELAPLPIDLHYRDIVNPQNQRLMPIRVPGSELKAVRPNLSRLWNVPSADGYSALVLTRISHLLNVNESGQRLTNVWNSSGFDLDLMAVRYVFMAPHKTTVDAEGVRWFGDDWQQWLGVGCDASGPRVFTIPLPAAVKSTTVAVVSRLACSTGVTDGTEVARVRIIDTNEQVQTGTLVAGRDTSEWAYDCESVRAAVRHQRAPIFSDYPAQMYDQPCSGHFYLTRLTLKSPTDIKRLEFEWVPGPASLIVEKLSLLDETTGTSYPLDAALTQPARWRLVEETAEARVYENLRVMPRAWLANEMVTVPAAEALEIIKSGAFKDGRAFDPHQVALLEEPANFAAALPATNASATVTSLTDTQLEVRTASPTASFLVTSDAYYTGWRALIDGQETKLFRADYALRGIVLPPGQHVVSFVYHPRSYYFGAVVSVCSLIMLVAIGVWPWRSRTRQ